MGSIQEVAEVFTGTKTAGRRVQPGGLIAPAAVERMFVYRQQLQMGEAHPLRVRHQLVRQLAVAEPEMVIGVAAPRAKVHFINRNRCIKLVGLLTGLWLFDLFRHAADKRRAFRAHLCLKGIRVGFHPQVAVGVNQLELIQLAVMRAGDKQLPDAGLFAQTHRVAAAVPVVELSDHRHTTGVRRPDGKTRPGDAVHGVGMGSQRLVGPQMSPFSEQPGIKLLQQRAKAIGVVNQVLLTVPGDGQLVTKRIFPARQNAAKEPACVEAFEFTDFAPGFRFNHPYIGGIG